jgi:hypothetical protein
MPTARQLIVEYPARTFGRGSSDSIAARSCFPNSPIYTMSDDQVRRQYESPPELVDGRLNDGGHTFGSVSRYYADAPDITRTPTGGGGLPGTPYSPNIASPTESFNPSTIPDTGAEAAAKQKGGGGYGVGDGLASPSATTPRMFPRRIGESLTLGRSIRL